MNLNFGLILTLFITLTRVFSANYEPKFDDENEDIRVTAGQTATLPCSAKHKGHHRIIWMNPKRILFSNEDQIVINDRRVGIKTTPNGDWKLIINHVRYNDTGEYMCQINTSPVKVKRVFLYVQVPSHILNDVSSRDIDVEEGDTVTLRCKATGVPQPNITWYKRSLQALEGKDNLNHVGERLVIRDIQRFQSGMYICMAYNNVEPAVTRQMEIKVQYPPIVKVLNSKLGQVLGKETILECTVTSYPRAKITWIKNGVAIEHSYKYRLEVYAGNFEEMVTLSLQIRYVNENDYGDYTCEAINRMGHSKSTMVLYEYKDPTITERTEPYTTYFRRTTTPSEDLYTQYWVDPYYQPEKGDYDVLSDSGKYDVDKTYLGRIHDQHNYDANRDGGEGSASFIRSDLVLILVCVMAHYGVPAL